MSAWLEEFRRVLRPGRGPAVCVISASDRAPMWGALADALGHFLPEQRNILDLSFALADLKGQQDLLAGAASGISA